MVDVDVGLRALQLCGQPDAEDGDVDYADVAGDGPLHAVDFAGVSVEEADAVDDDLKEDLNLDNPEDEDEKEKLEAAGVLVILFGKRKGVGGRSSMSGALRLEHLYLGPTVSRMYNHDITPMIVLAANSVQIMVI